MKIKDIYRISIRGIFVWIAVSLLTACSEDFLNPVPTTALGEDEAFESYTTAQAALIGVYDQLSRPQFEGHYIPIMSDIIGEDVMVNSENNYNWFIPVYQLEVLPNYFYNNSVWTAGYKIIHDANRIIKNADEIPDADQTEINQMIGEAKAIRAYAMLRMAQIFAPAYISDPTASSILNVVDVYNPEDEDLGRATNEVVYQQIVGDLLSAIDLMTGEESTEDEITEIVNKGFFNARSAKAVLARAYLDMGKWTEAKEMAKSARQGATLMTVAQMTEGFDRSNSESIFSLAYTSDDNNIYLTIPSFYWPVAGYSSMRATTEFVESFHVDDWRRKGLFHWQDNIDSDNYLILKFRHNGGQIGNAERICIRAAEMYLIEAEAEAQLGNYHDARDLLYTIQRRSHDGVIKSTSSGQALINEILFERRKELFGEGFRWNDIKRTQSRFVRTGDHWVKFDFGPEDAEYNQLTFPIPQAEIDANSKLTQADQNPGY